MSPLGGAQAIGYRAAVSPRATLRAAIFGVVALSSLYFVQGGGWNQNSRYDLTRALVEDGSLQIDRFAHNTRDKSVRDGHFYSDKAPGLSFAAAPIFALVRLVAPSNAERAPTPGELHALTWPLVGLGTALTAVLLAELMQSFGIGAVAATLAALGWALGTHAAGYATLFVAHQFVATLLVASFALLWFARARPAPRRGAMYVAAGFVAAWAAISEYPVAPLCVGLFACACALGRMRGAALFVAGAIAPLALLAAYNDAAFGAPWRLGYGTLASAHFGGLMSRGVFGVGLPDPLVLVAIVGGEYRGLLPLAPFLILAVPGLSALARRERSVAFGGTIAFAYGLLLTSGYAVWDGGAALGPRHLLPMLPALIPFVGAGIDRALSLGRPWKVPAAVLVGALLVASLTVCTVCVSVMPEFPDVPDDGSPLAQIARAPIRNIAFAALAEDRVSEKALLRDGRMSFAALRPGHDDDAFNLGEWLGLRGAASLVPLLAMWLAMAALLAVTLRRLGSERVASRGSEPTQTNAAASD
jgi:hypothetical protein